MTKKNFTVFILCLQLFSPTTWGTDIISGFSRSEDVRGGSGNVFITGQSPGAVLMRVNLWGDVSKSGIHYIPPRTDFITLLSYAGGPGPTANLEECYIKRQTKDSEVIIPVNIKDIVKGDNAHNPTIEPNDVVVIPTVEPVVSDNSLKTLTVISTVLSVVLASLVIEDRINGD